MTPWTVAHQAPPSMGFSRQEYWRGLPFPSQYLVLIDFGLFWFCIYEKKKEQEQIGKEAARTLGLKSLWLAGSRDFLRRLGSCLLYVSARTIGACNNC